MALKLAKAVGANPREFADEIAAAARGRGIASVEVAGPGFINIRVEAGRPGVPPDVVAAGAAYGTDDVAGRPINVEFVWANPTGPLHIGHTRWAASATRIARC